MSARYENPALTVDAVWLHRGRVLLVRRARPPFQGFWALPGGFVELRETVEEALARELNEETGLRGRRLELLGVYSGPDRDPRKPTTSVAFLVHGQPGWPRAGDDAGDAKWIPLKEVGTLAFDHNQILQDAQQRASRTARSRAKRRSAAPGPSVREGAGTSRSAMLRRGHRAGRG